VIKVVGTLVDRAVRVFGFLEEVLVLLLACDCEPRPICDDIIARKSQNTVEPVVIRVSNSVA